GGQAAAVVRRLTAVQVASPHCSAVVTGVDAWAFGGAGSAGVPPFGAAGLAVDAAAADPTTAGVVAATESGPSPDRPRNPLMPPENSSPNKFFPTIRRGSKSRSSLSSLISLSDCSSAI